MDQDNRLSGERQGQEKWSERSSGHFFWKFSGTAGAIVLFFAIKFAISYTSSELQVKSSQYTTWDNQFRDEFVNSCAGSAKKELAGEFSPAQLQDARIQKMIDVYSLSFCQCSSKAIEESDVIATKYNKIGRSLAQAEQESVQQIQSFMASSDGSKILEACREKAIQVAKK